MASIPLVCGLDAPRSGVEPPLKLAEIEHLTEGLLAAQTTADATGDRGYPGSMTRGAFVHRWLRQ
jgi:hypothetical protein